MAKAISERIELPNVDYVALEIVAEAAAAALARLDALGVSPLQACLSQGRFEAMDDQGQFDAEEPAFSDHGVDPADVDDYGAAADAAAAVFVACGVGQRTGSIIVTVPMPCSPKSAPWANTCRSQHDHGSNNRT
ncbi:MAG: hypothetical protein H2055_08310 [Sphingopyxis sp.]|nr:hypothetical protein [Sphingopyxis sp.]